MEAFDPTQLNPAEQIVVDAAERGDWAFLLRRPDDPKMQPEGEKPNIRASFLRHMLLRLPVSQGRGRTPKPWTITATGVRVLGATIDGELDLTDAAGISGDSLPPLALEYCDIAATLRLDNADIARLSLKGCRLREVSAYQIGVEGQIDLSYLSPLPIEDKPDQCRVRMNGARIDGDLNCAWACFVAPPKRDEIPVGGTVYALHLVNAEIQGTCYASYINAVGGVALSGCRINGDAIFLGAKLAAGEGAAFDAQSVHVQGSLSLKKCSRLNQAFESNGLVRLFQAKIVNILDCGGGVFRNQGADAITVEAADIGGGCLMRYGFAADGGVRLYGAKIAGNLECDGGTFQNPGKDALTIEGAEIGRACLMRNGFVAGGRVNLYGATIAGNLGCDGGVFRNEGADAFAADSVEIGGACLLRNKFTAVGRVSLLGAKIIGNLTCDRGHFNNPKGDALTIEGAEIGGACLMRDGFAADGCVRLFSAKIGKDFEFQKSTFKNAGQAALIMTNASVAGTMKGNGGVEIAGDVQLDRLVVGNLFQLLIQTGKPRWSLIDAKFGTLDDSDGRGWGGIGTIIVADGLSYQRLHVVDKVRAWEKRKKWLEVHVEPKDANPTHVYGQLAKVFTAMGMEDEARYVLRHASARSLKAKARDLRRLSGSWLTRTLEVAAGFLFWGGFAFGYSTSRATLTMVGFLVFGWLATDYANTHDLMAASTTPVAGAVQAKPFAFVIPAAAKDAVSDVPCHSVINPALFAIDSFVPLAELQQEDKCEFADISKDDSDARRLLVTDWWRWGKAIYGVIGALVTSLFLLTYSGILRKRGESEAG